MSGPDSARGLVVATLRRVPPLLGLAGWALVGALPTLASGQAVARAVDDGFLAGRAATGLAWLAGLAATVPLGALGARRTYLGVARLVEPLRDQLVTRVVEGALRSSTRDRAVSGHAGAVARLTQHVEIVRDTVAGLLLLLLSFVATVIAALVGLVALAPAVLPLVFVPLAVAFGAFGLSLPEVARRQRRVLLAEERVADLAGETAGGLRDIVACGGEDATRAVLDGAVAEQVAAGRALARVAALRTVIVAFGARLPLLLVLVAAGWLLDRGLSAGALLGTLTYLLQGLGPAVSSVVGGVGIPLAQLLVTVDRIDATVPGPPPPAGRERPADDGLELRGVTFRYRRAAEPVIDGLDLDVAPGEHLAVVGPSGAGKSTLAALLVGLLEPQAGTIRHGGRPAHEVDAGCRVLIPQQAYVFRGSVDENVRYLHPGATAAQRDRAIAAVGLGPLVERLGGPEADIEPGQLSAGERQLVSLARAHLAPAGLLVLDEATCHLDPAAEARVEEAFAARGATLVVIAHRITSAERARRILLLDGAEAVVGTHVDLVGRSTLYRDLVGHWLDPAHGDPADVDPARGEADRPGPAQAVPAS
jgi:ATP-binding cassette subfamily C protein